MSCDTQPPPRIVRIAMTAGDEPAEYVDEMATVLARLEVLEHDAKLRDKRDEGIRRAIGQLAAAFDLLK